MASDVKLAEGKYEFDPFSAEMMEYPYDVYRLLRGETPEPNS